MSAYRKRAFSYPLCAWQCSHCDFRETVHYEVCPVKWHPGFKVYGRPLDKTLACGECNAVNDLFMKEVDGSVLY